MMTSKRGGGVWIGFGVAFWLLGIGVHHRTRAEPPPAVKDRPAEDVQHLSRSAYQVMLARRQAEVDRLEAQVKALREEVERQLADNRVSLEMESKRAEAAFEEAKLARQVAEIAVVEYENGIFPREEETLLGAVKSAEDALRDAQKEADAPKGLIAQLRVQRAEFALEQATTKLKILREFDRKKRLLELQSEVQRAKAGELARLADWEQIKEKASHRARMIQKYKATAPEDLVVATLEDATRLDLRLWTLVEEAGKLSERIAAEPGNAKKLNDRLKEKREEARQVADEAKARLGDGLDLAKHCASLREFQRRAEVELKQARENLERLRKLNPSP